MFSLNLGATSHIKTPCKQKYVQNQSKDTNVICKTYLKPKKPWIQGVN